MNVRNFILRCQAHWYKSQKLSSWFHLHSSSHFESVFKSFISTFVNFLQMSKLTSSSPDYHYKNSNLFKLQTVLLPINSSMPLDVFLRTNTMMLFLNLLTIAVIIGMWNLAILSHMTHPTEFINEILCDL